MTRTQQKMGIVSVLPVLQSLALILTLASQATAQTPQGPQEGIKVRGHWTIEVTNPDGTRAQYREFDNALVPEGGGAISAILGQRVVPSTWFIWLGNNGSVNPCVRAATVNTSCGITTPIGAQGTSPTEFFPTLNVSAPATGPNAGGLVLSGNATSTATAPSTIGYVLSQMWMCPSTLLPGTGCLGAGATQANITQAQVAPPIPIQPGQVIQVTVVISFSSAHTE